ncbi:TGS-like protein [Pseudocohnilembus persalinus]|uniref:Obg-like ATPase homolog n=1 Tax=Pseudocohnilembus persalinus TaxID=266149 RepID=A0A0V0R071_PSEPJ|nr:TGS-like protein [Pseudocohnilembus persalinus]|eukprot:KRX07544.1 TGS-like protein [Pseudocohnilembus persalinus]
MQVPQISEEELNSVYNWVDEIPLSRPKKNISRDFADGVLIAEIVNHFLPQLIELHNYSAANSLSKKKYNWETLNFKVFKKLGFQLSKQDIEQVINAQPEYVERIIKVIQNRIENYRQRKGHDNNIYYNNSQIHQKSQQQQFNQSAQFQQGQDMNNYFQQNQQGQGDMIQQQQMQQNMQAMQEIIREKDQDINELRETVELNNQISLNFGAKKKAKTAQKGQQAAEEQVFFGRRGASNLKMGIVGMANVGKSTTFNLISKQTVPAENFPFCTIDPNIAVIQIPDKRFDKLVEIYDPVKVSPPTLQLIDIAGLVKGASEGEGLGNEFLTHIKQVDGIFQVVRAFEKDDILHTEGEMDPIRDMQIIRDELILKDIQMIESQMKEVQKKAEKSKQPDAIHAFEAMKKSLQLLNERKWLRFQKWNQLEVNALNRLHLLSTKPVTFLVNQSKQDYQENNCKFDKDIEQWIKEFGGEKECQVIKYSAELEKTLENSNKMEEIILNGYKLLNLIHYFTVGKDECKSWSVRNGSTAPQSAAQIHTDFEKGFVQASVINYDEYIKNTEKYQSKVRKEGKQYIVQDGDIINFTCTINKS